MDTTKGKGELLFIVNGMNLGSAFEGIPLDKPLVPCIILKNEDGTFTPLVLVFDKNGANWWFEKR